MKNLLLLLCLGSWACFPASAQTEKSAWAPKDIIETEYLRSASISPNNQLMVWSKQKPVKKKDRFASDLYLTRFDLEKDGEFRTFQLTNSDDSDYSPLFSKDNETIYFLSGREKGKKLWKMSIYGGEPQAVHTFEQGISSIRWKDENTLLFVSNDGKTNYEKQWEEKKDNTIIVEDSLHWRIDRVYSFDLKEKKISRLTTNQHPVSSYVVSRDGKWLVTRLTMSRHYATDGKPFPEYYLYDLETGSKEQILKENREPYNFQFSFDSQTLFYLQPVNNDPEWAMATVSEIHFLHVQDKSTGKVPLDWANQMEDNYWVTESGLIAELPNRATRKLAFYNQQKNWQRKAIDLGKKNDHTYIMAMSEDGSKVVYEHSSSGQLPEYYVATVTNKKGNVTFENERVAVKLNKNLKSKSITRSEVITWKGWNDEEVTGLLYYPTDYEEGKKYPLMLSIHGGPSSVDLVRWRERWSTYPQILAEKGAFVLKPNYHGSSNHGLKFVESIKKNYYDLEMVDIVKGIEFLAEKGMVDKEKLGTMGWSNGAILTTMLTVRYPEMFKVACPGAGDVNWTSDYGTCRFGVQFDQAYFGGAPWDDVDGKNYNPAYIEKSPLFDMDKVLTPTIIFHGSADRAVPRDQGWEYYRALQQNAKAPVKFLWFPDQPHGLRKITHQLRKMTEELAWIDKYLFEKKDSTNEAFQKGSPLAMLLKKEKAKSKEGIFGEAFNGMLIPEVRAIQKDSSSIGVFEVTQAQFKAFAKEDYDYPAHQANFPARVTHQRAEEYVAWLAKTTGKPYRLPTAAEAEKLHAKARKTATNENTLRFWAGYDLAFPDVTELKSKLSEVHTDLFKPVGQFKPQKIGGAEIYDLGGNVAEYFGNEGKTYGYSAYDYADPGDEEVHPGEGHIGFRVMLD